MREIVEENRPPVIFLQIIEKNGYFRFLKILIKQNVFKFLFKNIILIKQNVFKFLF